MLRHRDLLALLFSADMEDPNYMPVTRDLSKAKRQLLLQWLRAASAEEEPAAAPRAAAVEGPAGPAEEPRPARRFPAGPARPATGVTAAVDKRRSIPPC